MTQTYYQNLSEGLSKYIVSKIEETYTGGVTVPAPDDLDDNINTWTLEYLGTPPTEIALSEVRPDFESIVDQFRQELFLRETWRDILTAGTGQTIIEFIAAIGAYGQLGIQRALQETMLDTARLRSSIVSIARMLGIHVERKKPASVFVDLKREGDLTSTVTIPTYSTFDIAGIKYFNREAIIFNSGVTEQNSIILYQGEMTSSVFTSSGQTYQRYEFGPADFSISDDDLLCSVSGGGGEYIRTIDGLWNFEADVIIGGETFAPKVFYENTLPDGRVEVRFGNNIYGSAPGVNTDITFRYPIVLGSKANTSETGLIVTITTFTSISGVTTTAIQNGTDEKDLDFYRAFAPLLFAANKRMVTRDDYRALALTYPGIIDAVFVGQHELGPQEKEWMNIVGVTLITQSNWDNSQWNEFVNWGRERGIYQTEWHRVDPLEVKMDITAIVSCNNDSNLTLVKQKIEKALIDFFKPRAGSLGYTIYISDVHRVIEDTSSEVNFVQLIEPKLDLTVKTQQYITLGDVSLTMQYTSRGDREVEIIDV